MTSYFRISITLIISLLLATTLMSSNANLYPVQTSVAPLRILPPCEGCECVWPIFTEDLRVIQWLTTNPNRKEGGKLMAAGHERTILNPIIVTEIANPLWM